MGDCVGTISIEAPAADVFDFLSEIHNLTRCVSALITTRPIAREALHVTVVVAGEQLHERGWFHVDAAARTLAWGSNNPNCYRGHLTVSDYGDTSTVTVALTSNRHTATTEIQQSLDASLTKIKRHTEAHHA